MCRATFQITRVGVVCSIGLITAVALTACDGGKTAQETGGSRPPNVVLIVADDMGYGDAGVYGHPTIRTPNLDRMAAEGMKFTQFYVGSSTCTPSRAALLTGRYPIRSGVTEVLIPSSSGGLPQSEVTIAEALKEQGYATGIIGKWHLGSKPQYLPLNHGFDYYFGVPYSNDMSPDTQPDNPLFADSPPTPIIRNFEVMNDEEPDHGQFTRLYTEEAIGFMRQYAGKQPFLLYLAHTMPHVPLGASEAFRGKSEAGLYGDVMEEIDWSTGEVLRAIDELGITNNTLVLFTSDNGPWLAKKDQGGSAGPFREGKVSTWEGGTVSLPFFDGRERFLAASPPRHLPPPWTFLPPLFFWQAGLFRTIARSTEKIFLLSFLKTGMDGILNCFTTSERNSGPIAPGLTRFISKRPSLRVSKSGVTGRSRFTSPLFSIMSKWILPSDPISRGSLLLSLKT